MPMAALEALEIAHRLYFSTRPRLGPKTLEALDGFPRSEALAYEMILAEWHESRGRGDLHYAIQTAQLVIACLDGKQDAALQILSELTGRNWSRELVVLLAKRKDRPADAESEIFSVVWELVAELSDRASRGLSPPVPNQRAALAGAIRNSLIDYADEQQRGARPATVFRDEPEIEACDQAAPTLGLSIDEGISLKLLISKADLTENEGQAIRLRLQGLEGEALARALGTTEGAARKRIHEALKKVRSAM